MMAHALLSPSAAHRWLYCTAAPLLEQTFPDTGSEYTAEGTLAHAVAELKLRKYTEPMSQRTFTTRYNKLKKDPLWQPEMDGHTETYLDFIKQIYLQQPVAPAVRIEERVELESYAPSCFGTADCLILAGDELYVIDFKYGKGVLVSAEQNPQMMLYALGALEKYQLLYAFKTVHLAIVQLRLNNISTWTSSAELLQSWGETEVRPAAQLAVSGKGVFCPGTHCRFCKAKLQCKARAEHYAAAKAEMDANPNPKLLAPADISRLLPIAAELETWAKDLKDYALKCCLDDIEIPGYKAVEGRGSREFTNLDEAFKVLIDNGTEKAMLYNTVPLTLAQAEKVIGAKQFNELLKDYIVKKPGKPALAKESDKRPAITGKPKAADVFGKGGLFPENI